MIHCQFQKLTCANKIPDPSNLTIVKNSPNIARKYDISNLEVLENLLRGQIMIHSSQIVVQLFHLIEMTFM